MRRPRSKRSDARVATELLEEASEKADRSIPDDARERLALKESHYRQLDLISEGFPVVGADRIIQAARLRLDFCQARPAQGVALQQNVTFTFVDPYGDGPDAVIEVGCNPAALPLVAGESILDRAERVAREREKLAVAPKV